MAELDAFHYRYSQELFKSELSEEDIEKEMDVVDDYKTKYLEARLKAVNLTNVIINPSAPPDPIHVHSVGKSLKLPTIELPKFSGSFKEWLPFWSQFKKIDSDANMSVEDKLQYLLQCTVSGSKANVLVKSFPSNLESYKNAIETLKNRFGQDEIIVEYYITELQVLVLQNAKSGNKKVSDIYDKLESSIRALNSLGVTTDKCAAMLYPLVESALLEDILRAWQRSMQKDLSDDSKKEDRLTRLLEFLRLEVDNEERINMALHGFGESEEQRVSKGKQKDKGSDKNKDVASASVLLTTKSKTKKNSACVFCNEEHESGSCDYARKIDLEKRRQLVKDARACLKCMTRGHMSRDCKVRVTCSWCGKWHALFMCFDVNKTSSTSSTSFAGQNKSAEKKDFKVMKETNLAHISKIPEAYLQTLQVMLY